MAHPCKRRFLDEIARQNEIFALRRINVAIQCYQIRRYCLVIGCGVKILITLVIVAIERRDLSFQGVRKTVLKIADKNMCFESSEVDIGVAKYHSIEALDRVSITAGGNSRSIKRS